MRETVRLRNQAEYFGFQGVRLLKEMSAEEMAKIYNGTGPEWMDERYRIWLTRLTPDLQSSVLVHDIFCDLAPTTADSYRWVNRTLRVNGYRIAKGMHKGILGAIRRWLVEHEARAGHRICDLTCALAWMEGHEEARRIFAPERLAHLQAVAAECVEKDV